jgi:hypothetical protein
MTNVPGVPYAPYAPYAPDAFDVWRPTSDGSIRVARFFTEIVDEGLADRYLLRSTFVLLSVPRRLRISSRLKFVSLRHTSRRSVHFKF